MCMCVCALKDEFGRRSVVRIQLSGYVNLTCSGWLPVLNICVQVFMCKWKESVSFVIPMLSREKDREIHMVHIQTKRVIVVDKAVQGWKVNGSFLHTQTHTHMRAYRHTHIHTCAYIYLDSYIFFRIGTSPFFHKHKHIRPQTHIHGTEKGRGGQTKNTREKHTCWILSRCRSK